MILDSLENLSNYALALPGVEKVVEFIASNDIYSLPEEKIFIDGDSLFAIPAVGEGKLAENAKLEVHNRYADIQICLGLSETFGWKNRKVCASPIGAFNDEKDILFFEDAPSTYLTIGEGEFVIFFPHDAHAPMIASGTLKKLIFKVKVD